MMNWFLVADLRAGSMELGLLVAAITITWDRCFRPSMRVSSCDTILRLRPSFLLFISSMLASFSVIRDLSFRSNVPTLIPTYNTLNQSLVTNSKFLA